MKKKWLAALLIYIALIAVCLVVIYAVPSIRGLLEKTYITEFSTISITDDVSAYIVRDETVHTAKYDSSVNRLAEQGELVKSNARAVELTPFESDEEREAREAEAAESGTDESADEDKKSGRYASILEELGDDVRSTKGGYTKDAGYVSYYVDGQEARLCTENLADLTRDELEDLTKKRAIETPKSKCSAGDPVFKIVDNRKWYLVFYLDNKDGEKYYEGRTVTVDVNGEQVPVKVRSVDAGKKTTKVILTCKMFFDGFLEERTMKTTVTVASAEGLLVQDKSIIEKDGQVGVLVKNKLGEHRFRPIRIKADDGEKCVVYADIYVDDEGNYVETLSTYDEIVAEPTEEDIENL